MNYRKKGLKRLIDGILEESVGRLILTYNELAPAAYLRDIM